MGLLGAYAGPGSKPSAMLVSYLKNIGFTDICLHGSGPSEFLSTLEYTTGGATLGAWNGAGKRGIWFGGQWQEEHRRYK